MRKTESLLGWLVCGIFACACSSSTSHKDAGVRDSSVGDSARGEVGQGEAGEAEFGLADAAAGDVASGDASVQAAVITIGSGMVFATTSLVVPAETTITVQNQDSLPHTVTSETARNAFQPSGAFDTGVIPGGGSATITLSADATPGTVFYYYCTIHRSLMTPPNGAITIQ